MGDIKCIVCTSAVHDLADGGRTGFEILGVREAPFDDGVGEVDVEHGDDGCSVKLGPKCRIDDHAVSRDVHHFNKGPGDSKTDILCEVYAGSGAVFNDYIEACVGLINSGVWAVLDSNGGVALQYGDIGYFGVYACIDVEAGLR